MYKLIFSLIFTLSASVVSVPYSYAAKDNISHHEKRIISIKQDLLKIQSEISEKLNKLDSHILDVKSLSETVDNLKEDKEVAKTAYLRIQATDAELVDIDLSEKVAEVQNKYNLANKKYKSEKRKLKKLISVQNNIQRSVSKHKITTKSAQAKLNKAINNLVAVKLNQQIKKIQTPHAYKARGEAGCGEAESLKKCKVRAKHEAERKIIEKGSVIDIKTVTEIKNFELTNDEIRNEVQAKLSNIKVIKKGFLGENGFYYIISATVTPSINKKLKSTLRRSIAADIDAFVKNIRSSSSAIASPSRDRNYLDPELKAAEKRAIMAEQNERELQAKIKANELRQQLNNEKVADTKANERSNIIKEQQEKAANQQEASKPKRRIFGGW